jgi:hypothetical protein
MKTKSEPALSRCLLKFTDHFSRNPSVAAGLDTAKFPLVTRMVRVGSFLNKIV